MMDFENFKNANGTYNGVKALSALTGLSEAEVEWTSLRVKELVIVQKMSRPDALAQIKREAATKPWKKR